MESQSEIAKALLEVAASIKLIAHGPTSGPTGLEMLSIEVKRLTEAMLEIASTLNIQE